MAEIRVRLYGMLGKRRPDLADGGPWTTGAADLRGLLDEAGIPQAEAALVFVNGERATLERPLRDGDEVRVFPMLAGG